MSRGSLVCLPPEASTVIMRRIIPMKKWLFYFFLSCSSLVFLGFRVIPAAGAGEFATAYDVLYEVSETGKTLVTQEVALTNQTESFYATEYSLTVGSAAIVNVAAFDSQGPVLDKVTRGEETTTIHLVFNDQVAGLGNTLNWKLTYESTDVAVKNGQIWEINTPRLSKDTTINEYRLTFSVPSSFQDLLYIFPEPADREVIGGRQQFYFEKNNLGNYGVSAAFGKYQVFSFRLNYELTNPNFFPVTIKIPLPPNTDYQAVILDRLEPAPVNVEVDEDGNWLAIYKLASNEEVTVEAEGYAKIFAASQSLSPAKLSLAAQQAYLKPQKYWESDDSQIQALARELKTPQKIYNFVVQTLDYSQERLAAEKIERRGAAKALVEPDTSICMEFTDLFVALCRAAGIPARGLNGFAYTSDEKRRPLGLLGDSGQDVLHAWAEYYDDQRGWVPVDPTWEDTTKGIDFFNKLDLSHFVFVIHGFSSEQPFPPGSYKRDSSSQPQVIVNFAPEVPEKSLEPEVVFDLPQSVISGLPFSGQVKIVQKGNAAYYPTEIEIKSDFFQLTSDVSFSLEPQPPFSQREFAISLKSPKVTKNSLETITVFYDGDPYVENILVKPFLVSLLPQIATGAAIISGGLFVLLLIRRARR